MKQPLIILSLLVLFAVSCSGPGGVDPIRLEGSAMLPALKDGDMILIKRDFEKLERGDVVIFYFPQDQSMSYVKRIIGLPGETVEIREGEVVINGTTLREPYVAPQFNQSKRSLAEITLTPDSYFVMGDNRDNSSDSRVWGPLKKVFIYGKSTRKYSGTD